MTVDELMSRLFRLLVGFRRFVRLNNTSLSLVKESQPAYSHILTVIDSSKCQAGSVFWIELNKGAQAPCIVAINASSIRGNASVHLAMRMRTW
jgi:hypothetical protein